MSHLKVDEGWKGLEEHKEQKTGVLHDQVITQTFGVSVSEVELRDSGGEKDKTIKNGC